MPPRKLGAQSQTSMFRNTSAEAMAQRQHTQLENERRRDAEEADAAFDSTKDFIPDAAASRNIDESQVKASRRRKIATSQFRSPEEERKYYQLLELAQHANLSGDLHRAKGLATQAVRICPSADCFNLLQSVAESERDLHRANEYRLLTAFFSKDVVLWQELYTEYMDAGELQRSIMCLGRLNAMTTDPEKRYQYSIDRADLLLALGEVKAAERLFLKIWYASNETDFGIFSQISSLLYSRGRFETLQKLLTSAMNRSYARLDALRKQLKQGESVLVHVAMTQQQQEQDQIQMQVQQQKNEQVQQLLQLDHQPQKSSNDDDDQLIREEQSNETTTPKKQKKSAASEADEDDSTTTTTSESDEDSNAATSTTTTSTSSEDDSSDEDSSDDDSSSASSSSTAATATKTQKTSPKKVIADSQERFLNPRDVEEDRQLIEQHPHYFETAEDSEKHFWESFEAESAKALSQIRGGMGGSALTVALQEKMKRDDTKKLEQRPSEKVRRAKEYNEEKTKLLKAKSNTPGESLICVSYVERKMPNAYFNGPYNPNKLQIDFTKKYKMISYAASSTPASPAKPHGKKPSAKKTGEEIASKRSRKKVGGGTKRTVWNVVIPDSIGVPKVIEKGLDPQNDNRVGLYPSYFESLQDYNLDFFDQFDKETKSLLKKKRNNNDDDANTKSNLATERATLRKQHQQSVSAATRKRTYNDAKKSLVENGKTGDFLIQISFAKNSGNNNYFDEKTRTFDLVQLEAKTLTAQDKRNYYQKVRNKEKAKRSGRTTIRQKKAENAEANKKKPGPKRITRAATNPMKISVREVLGSAGELKSAKQQERERFNPQGHLTLVNIQSELYLERGRYEDAIRLVSQTIADVDLPSMSALPPDLALRLAVAFAMTGKMEQSQKLLNEMLLEALKNSSFGENNYHNNNNGGGGASLRDLVDVFYDGANTLMKLGQTHFAEIIFKTLRRIVFPLVGEDQNRNMNNENLLETNANNFGYSDFNYGLGRGGKSKTKNNNGDTLMTLYQDDDANEDDFESKFHQYHNNKNDGNQDDNYDGDDDEYEDEDEREEKRAAATAILYGLGRCCTIRGEIDEAEHTLIKALELSPDHTMTRIALAEIAAASDNYDRAIQLVTPTIEDEVNNEHMEKIRLHTHRARFCLPAGRYVDCVTSALFVITRWLTTVDDDNSADKESVVAGSSSNAVKSTRNTFDYNQLHLPKLSSSSSVLVPAYTLSAKQGRGGAFSALSSIASSFRASTVAKQSVILARRGPASGTGGSFVGSAVGRSSEYTSQIKHQTAVGDDLRKKKQRQQDAQETEEKFRVEGIFKFRRNRGGNGTSVISNNNNINNDEKKATKENDNRNNSDAEEEENNNNEDNDRAGSVGRLSDLDDFEEENFGINLNQFDESRDDDDDSTDDDCSDDNNDAPVRDDDGFALPSLSMTQTNKKQETSSKKKALHEKIRAEREQAERSNNSIPTLDEVAAKIQNDEFRNIFLEAVMGNPGSKPILNQQKIQQQQELLQKQKREQEEQNNNNKQDDSFTATGKKKVSFGLTPISFDLGNNNNNSSQQTLTKKSDNNNFETGSQLSSTSTTNTTRRTKLDEWREMDVAAQAKREANNKDVEFLIGREGVALLCRQCAEAYTRLGQFDDALEFLGTIQEVYRDRYRKNYLTVQNRLMWKDKRRAELMAKEQQKKKEKKQDGEDAESSDDADEILSDEENDEGRTDEEKAILKSLRQNKNNNNNADTPAPRTYAFGVTGGLNYERGDFFSDVYYMFGFPLEVAKFRVAVLQQTSSLSASQLSRRNNNRNTRNNNNRGSFGGSSDIFSPDDDELPLSEDDDDDDDDENDNTPGKKGKASVSCVRLGCDLLRQAHRYRNWADNHKNEVWEGIAAFMGCATTRSFENNNNNNNNNTSNFPSSPSSKQNGSSQSQLSTQTFHVGLNKFVRVERPQRAALQLLIRFYNDGAFGFPQQGALLEKSLLKKQKYLAELLNGDDNKNKKKTILSVREQYGLNYKRDFTWFSYVDEARCATIIGNTSFQASGGCEEACMWYLRALTAILKHEGAIDNGNNTSDDHEEILTEQVWQTLENRIKMNYRNSNYNNNNIERRRDRENEDNDNEDEELNSSNRDNVPSSTFLSSSGAVPYAGSHFTFDDVRLLLLLISLCYLFSTGNRRRSFTLKSPFTARAFAFLTKYGSFGIQNNSNNNNRETARNGGNNPALLFSTPSSVVMTSHQKMMFGYSSNKSSQNDDSTSRLQKLQIAYNTARTFQVVDMLFLAIPMYEKVIEEINCHLRNTNQDSSSSSSFAVQQLFVSLHRAASFNLSLIYSIHADKDPRMRGNGATAIHGPSSRAAAGEVYFMQGNNQSQLLPIGLDL